MSYTSNLKEFESAERVGRCMSDQSKALELYAPEGLTPIEAYSAFHQLSEHWLRVALKRQCAETEERENEMQELRNQLGAQILQNETNASRDPAIRGI